MLSDEAKQSSDLREILPRLLLFPKRKSGPGHPLGPDGRPGDRTIFTIKFLCKLEDNRECEPSEALEKIRDEMDTSVADKDDKTHWRWLIEELGLTKRPKTNAEWRAAGRAHYVSTYAGVDEAYREYIARKAEDKGAG
jgi:hypothetical protein